MCQCDYVTSAATDACVKFQRQFRASPRQFGLSQRQLHLWFASVSAVTQRQCDRPASIQLQVQLCLRHQCASAVSLKAVLPNLLGTTVLLLMFFVLYAPKIIQSLAPLWSPIFTLSTPHVKLFTVEPRGHPRPLADLFCWELCLARLTTKKESHLNHVETIHAPLHQSGVVFLRSVELSEGLSYWQQISTKSCLVAALDDVKGNSAI
jgi:hypothetical protein